MKRPEGFDGRRPQADSGGSPARRGRAARPERATPARAIPPRTTARSVTVPRRPAGALKEARAASRERHRYERREIRRFTRRTRHRRLGWVVALGIVGVLVGLLAVAIYSPLLALRTIRVEGTAAVSAEAVTAAVSDQLGTPLALLDYDRIRARLDASPLIRSFVTEAQPPSTLVVRITERRPVGAIPTSAGFAVVDPAGVVLSTSPGRVAGVPLIDVEAMGVESEGGHGERLLEGRCDARALGGRPEGGLGKRGALGAQGAGARGSDRRTGREREGRVRRLRPAEPRCQAHLRRRRCEAAAGP